MTLLFIIFFKLEELPTEPFIIVGSKQSHFIRQQASHLESIILVKNAKLELFRFGKYKQVQT